jgi:hypothetical protein
MMPTQVILKPIIRKIVLSTKGQPKTLTVEVRCLNDQENLDVSGALAYCLTRLGYNVEWKVELDLDLKGENSGKLPRL